MTHECPTHGTIPDVPWCPLCDVPDESIREMVRRVLVCWVSTWPDPQLWKHEARWQEDGIAIMSQKATGEYVWSATAFFKRTDLESLDDYDIAVGLQALKTWKELHRTAQQQGDTV
jgi:hypothetical protein